MFSKTPGGDIPPEGVKASDGTQGPDPQSAEGEQTRQTNHELSESEDLQTPARSDPARDNSIPAPQTPNPKPVKPRRLDYWGQFGLGIKAKVPTPPAPEGAAEVAPEVGPEPAPEVAPEAELGVAPEVSLQAGPEVALASSAPDSPDQIPSDQISPDQNAADLAPTGQAESGSPAGEGQAQAQPQPQTQDAKKALKSAKGLAYSSFGPAIKPQKPKTKAQKLSDEKSSPEEPDLAAVSPEAPVASKGLGENVESIQEPAPGAETKPILGETPGPSEPMIEQKPMLGPSPSIAEGLKLDTLKFESYPETILGDLRSSDSPAETITQSPAAEVKNVDSPKARINLSGLEAPDFGPTDESPGEPQALAEAVAKSVAEAVPEAVAESVPESVAESGGLPQADESGPAQPPLAAEDPDLRAGRPNFLTSTRFSDFDLPSEIMLGIEAAGFDCTTPIQAQVIPVALEGLDIAGQAQTGTGKTTAFLVPLLSRLIRKPSMNPGLPRALVITPTRELADQIYKDAKLLASATNISLALIMGGLEYREQSNALQDGADVVICTPGRLIDYLHQGIFVPSAVEVAVVDEADRLLDMGFIKDLKTILSKLPPFTHRQTMLFSATLDDRVLELTYQYMNPPQYITAEPDPQSKIQIDQTLYHVSNSEKLPLLIGLLRHQEHSRVIIFCNTRSRVDWLTKKLTLNGFQAEGITGDLPQAKRLKLMQAFKDQRLQIMVATDVASRGIHVEDVSHVYNYDLPQDSENYIHRIGRTARAGKTGKAISFACEEHVYHLEAIENLLGEKIPVVWPDEALFDKDQAGDVKFRERERPRDLGRDRDRDRDRDRERPSSRPSRPAPIPFQERSERRIPVQVNRPGGIFGISPRFPVQNGAVDVRQVLSWKPSEFTAEDAKISRARSAKPARQGAYAQNGSAQDSPYDSYGPEPRPEPRPEAKRPEPTGAPHPYAPDPEPPLYFGPEPEGLDDSYDDRALASDRDNRRRKRPRGKLGRDFDGPNGFHDAPAQGPKKSDRRAQKEALRKTLIEDDLEAKPVPEPLEAQKRPPVSAQRPDQRPDRRPQDARPQDARPQDTRAQDQRPQDALAQDQRLSAAAPQAPARGDSRPEPRPDARPSAKPQARPQAKAKAPEPIDCQAAVEQEYVDSGLVEQHPNVALAASEELAAQATKTDQGAQASVPAKPEPQAPASSLAPAASVAPAAPAAAEVELDFWGRPKSPAPTLDQAPPTEPASPLAAQAGAKAEPKVQEPQAQEPKVLEGAVKDDPFSSLVIHETSEVMSEISPKAASVPTFDHMPSRGEAASIKPDQTGKPAKPTEDVSAGPDLFGQTIDQEPRAKETTLEDIVVSAQGPSAQPPKPETKPLSYWQRKKQRSVSVKTKPQTADESAPEAKAPEAKAIEPAPPEAKAPEAKAIEPTPPEAKAPEAPEPKAIEPKAPETKAIESIAPEVVTPEAKAPQAKPAAAKAAKERAAKESDQPKRKRVSSLVRLRDLDADKKKADEAKAGKDAKREALSPDAKGPKAAQELSKGQAPLESAVKAPQSIAAGPKPAEAKKPEETKPVAGPIAGPATGPEVKPGAGPEAKLTEAKKPETKKPVAKKAQAKKPEPAKPVATKAEPAKPEATKAEPKKAAAKKAEAKKPVAAKPVAKAPAVKTTKTAAAKPEAAKPVATKAEPKKAAVKKAEPKKPVAAKPVATKAEPKKAAAKKPEAKAPAVKATKTAAKGAETKTSAAKGGAGKTAAAKTSAAKGGGKDAKVAGSKGSGDKAKP